MPLRINIAKKPLSYPAREVGARCKYTTTDNLKTSAGHGLKTFDIATCVGLNLNTENKVNKMFHLAPEFNAHQNYNFLMNFFEEQVYKMQEQFGKINAFIYGGIEFDAKNASSKGSFNLYNNLADIMEELNVPFSMLCGKKPMVKTHDNMHAIDDRLTIWNDAYKEMGKNLDEIANEDKLEFLRSKYQFVETTGDDFFSVV